MENELMAILQVGIDKGFFQIVVERGKEKIVYIQSSNHKEIISDPEEQVRAVLYLELIDKYKYPANRIELEVEMPDRTPDRFADIVVYLDDAKTKPYIVIECKKDGLTDTLFEQATKQAIANSRVLKSTYAFCVAGLTRRAMETDLWNDKDPEIATIADIPISYSKVEEFRYRKGDPDWDLKKVTKQELKRALQKANDTLWGGGKRNPTVAFDELCKIIFTKIRDEKKLRKNGEFYDFQIATHESAESVFARINGIYLEGKEKDPEIFNEGMKVKPEELYLVVRHLQAISLHQTDLDVKGVAFEQFMEDFFKGKSGQYFTPREIVDLTVQLIGLNNEDKVLDPACGSGGFLLNALDVVRSKAEEYYPDKGAECYSYWHNFASNNLFGIEISDSIARVAKMNMIIHDDGHTNVICHDALDVDGVIGKHRGFEKGKFDVIITNPPFGVDILQKNHNYLGNYELGKKNNRIRNSQSAEILFLELCEMLLKPNVGKIAIILPDSITVNPSNQFVRDYLLQHFQILAILSLPDFTFSAFGANVKSSILIMKKQANGNDKDHSTFMANIRHIGYTASAKIDPKNDISIIMDSYKRFQKGQELNLDGEHKDDIFIVPSNELITSNRLDPNAFSPVFKRLKKSILDSELDCDRHPLSELINTPISGEWGDDPITFTPKEGYELCYVLRNTNFDNKFNLDYSDVAERYIKSDKIRSLQLKKGDILIEKSGGSPVQPVGRVALVIDFPTDKPIIFSNFLSKITSKEGYSSEFIFTYLQSLYKLGYMEYIQNQTTGIKNLLMEEFLSIVVNVPKQQDAISKISDLHLNQMKDARIQIEEAMKKYMESEKALQATLFKL